MGVGLNHLSRVYISEKHKCSYNTTFHISSKEISGLGHHPFFLLWTTEVKSTIYNNNVLE